MTYTTDITDAGQYILQEAFAKVGHELETAQKDLLDTWLVTREMAKDLGNWMYLATSTVYSFLEVIPDSCDPVFYRTSLGPWQRCQRCKRCKQDCLLHMDELGS